MRIGINVPNELVKRMEPFRHAVNLSQVCRDAIKNWVDAYERARLRATEDHMEEAADRLWQEHEARIVDWEVLGHEDAKLWVGLASLRDFENLFHNLKVSQRLGRSPEDFIPVWGHIPGTRTFWNRQAEYKEWFYHLFERDDQTNHYFEAQAKYNLSWLWYVNAVWEMVKERIGRYAEAHNKARDEARAQIEVPAHLTKAGRTT